MLQTVDSARRALPTSQTVAAEDPAAVDDRGLPAPAVAPDLGALALRAQAGDRPALETVLSALYPRIHRYCSSRLFGSDEAQDVCQEVMIAVTQALPRYRDQGSPLTAWVFGIAANKVADAQRRHGRGRTVLTDELPETAAVTAGPEALAEQADTARQVQGWLATLPAQSAEIVRLRVAAGLTAEETAAVLGTTPGAVRVAQHRALAKLRSLADATEASA